MGRMILITGGSRSGKSVYAQRLAEAHPGRRAFIATCAAIDDEMRERIQKHRRARSHAAWHTIEEPVDLAGAVRNSVEFDFCVVDCLTLWVSNVMCKAHQEKCEITEDIMTERCRELTAVCEDHSGTIAFVTNEVGMGIVPDNAAARRFRDLAGRCNQLMAAAADDVILVTCGLPLSLKGKDSLERT